MTDRRAFWVVVVLLLAYVMNPATGSWARSVAQSAGQMYRYRNSSRETRAQSLLGEPWRLIQEARRATRPDATILIPDGREAAPLSNRIWCAYYLYPRHLVRRAELDSLTHRDVDFVLVHPAR